VPVVVASKTRLFGSVTPPALNVEATVVEISPQEDDYIVEGYIDLSPLSEGDMVEVREYVAVDGANYQLFLRTLFAGPVPEPVIRFHAKTLLKFMKYKLAVVQASGAVRSLPYGFVVEVLGLA